MLRNKGSIDNSILKKSGREAALFNERHIE